MKMMKYFLLALISAGLFACSNDDDDQGTGPDADEPKTITLSIKSLESVKMRSVGKKTTDTKIKLSKAYILFNTENGEVVDVKVVESDGSGADDPINKLISDEGLTFHDINNAVENIAVIGNPVIYDISTPDWQPSITMPEKGDVISDIEKDMVSAFDQQNQDYISLYGKGALGDPVKVEEHGDAVKYNAYVYQPEITVKALVSRFEIGNIQCEDLGVIYGDLVVRGIGMVDFYEYETLDGTVSSKLSEGVYKIDKNGSVIAKSGQIFDPAYSNNPDPAIDPFFSFSESAGRIGWRYESAPLEGGAEPRLGTGNDQYNPALTQDPGPERGVFAFNFIPEVGEFPNIKLWVNIFSKDNPTLPIGTNWFVTTSGFDVTDNLVWHPAPGYIYTLDFKFKEENLGDYNHDIRCADVKVKITPWVLEEVEPRFK